MKRLKKKLTNELNKLSILFFDKYENFNEFEILGKNYQYKPRNKHPFIGSEYKSIEVFYYPTIPSFGVGGSLGSLVVGNKVTTYTPLDTIWVMRKIIEDFKELLGK